MTPKPSTDEEVLAALDAALADDMLAPETSDADVDRALAERGGDPRAVGERGAALAAKLLERRRLGWQERAAARIAKGAEVVAARMKKLVDVPRAEIVRLLEAARSDPATGGTVAAAFHKRRPEDATDEELRNLLAEVEALRDLAGPEGPDDSE